MNKNINVNYELVTRVNGEVVDRIKINNSDGDEEITIPKNGDTEILISSKNYFSKKKKLINKKDGMNEVFKLDKGNIAVGRDADVVVFDPEFEYDVDVQKFKSKSKNSPFHGWKVKGRVTHTLVMGKIVHTSDS